MVGSLPVFIRVGVDACQWGCKMNFEHHPQQVSDAPW
jgi:hypothetical protein